MANVSRIASNWCRPLSPGLAPTLNPEDITRNRQRPRKWLPESTQPKIHQIAIVLMISLAMSGCQKMGTVGVEERQAETYKVRTFYDTKSGNVEVLIATDGGTSIVALPRSAIARDAGMGDDELGCLGKCAKIEDLESRLNCILLCPVSKKWQVATVFAQK